LRFFRGDPDLVLNLFRVRWDPLVLGETEGVKGASAFANLKRGSVVSRRLPASEFDDACRGVPRESGEKKSAKSGATGCFTNHGVTSW
jgi:hypothetical protein